MLSTRTLLYLAATACIASPLAQAQMPSPAIDRPGLPFSYFSAPTDQIGVAGSPSATEITPESFLYTGFGELMFFVGPDGTAVTTNDGPRNRTLEDGYLPIESWSIDRGGLTYKFTVFAASLGPQPSGPVANFVRITVVNNGHDPRAAFLSTAVRYQAPQTSEGEYADNRFRRPLTPPEVGGYNQPGEAFNKAWVYAFDGNAAIRDNRVLYLFPQDPAPRLGRTLLRRYNERPLTSAGKVPEIDPTTPTGAAMYS
ncbi:MAG: hypothetical protein V4555_17725, partial [Acidobacteriota bacterium]